MTMHLLGPEFSTTNTRKRKPKKKTKSLLAAEREHEKFLKRMGVHPDQRANRATKKSRVEPVRTVPVDKLVSSNAPTYNASMAKPAEKVYSGERKLLGIATMHKSNMVPVFDKKSAEELSLIHI